MGYERIKQHIIEHGRCGKKKVANNTYLHYIVDANYIEMRLHGNTVAIFDIEGVELFSSGWHTPTTKDRLNFALQLAGIPQTVYQRDWQWYITFAGGDLLFYEGIKILYGGI